MKLVLRFLVKKKEKTVVSKICFCTFETLVLSHIISFIVIYLLSRLPINLVEQCSVCTAQKCFAMPRNARSNSQQCLQPCSAMLGNSHQYILLFCNAKQYCAIFSKDTQSPLAAIEEAECL